MLKPIFEQIQGSLFGALAHCKCYSADWCCSLKWEGVSFVWNKSDYIDQQVISLVESN